MELILRKNELRDRDKTLICHPPISVLILSLRQSCRMRLASLVISAMDLARRSGWRACGL
jgi:hypothetical protein